MSGFFKFLVIVAFAIGLWVMAELAFRGEFTFGQTIKDWLL
jgi:hypothetical protein